MQTAIDVVTFGYKKAQRQGEGATILHKSLRFRQIQICTHLLTKVSEVY
jgi:hypothetical protein